LVSNTNKRKGKTKEQSYKEGVTVTCDKGNKGRENDVV